MEEDTLVLESGECYVWMSVSLWWWVWVCWGVLEDVHCHSAETTFMSFTNDLSVSLLPAIIKTLDSLQIVYMDHWSLIYSTAVVCSECSQIDGRSLWSSSPLSLPSLPVGHWREGLVGRWSVCTDTHEGQSHQRWTLLFTPSCPWWKVSSYCNTPVIVYIEGIASTALTDVDYFWILFCLHTSVRILHLWCKLSEKLW